MTSAGGNVTRRAPRTLLHWAGALAAGLVGAALFQAVFGVSTRPDPTTASDSVLLRTDVHRSADSRRPDTGAPRRPVPRQESAVREEPPRSPPDALFAGAVPDDPRIMEAVEIRSSVVEPFEQEARTDSWARALERRLGFQLEDYARTAGAGAPELLPALTSVECRSSRCRMLLEYADRSAADGMQDKLIRGEVFREPRCRLRSIGFAQTDAEEVHQTLFLLCPEEPPVPQP